MCRCLREQARSHRDCGIASGCMASPQPHCRSEPARDGGVSGNRDVDWADAIASRLTPTGIGGDQDIQFIQFHCGSVACPRKRWIRQHRCCMCRRLREQARSHRDWGVDQDICFTLEPLWERGLPAKAVGLVAHMLNVPTPSRASPLLQGSGVWIGYSLPPGPLWERGLPAKAVCLVAHMLNVPTPSRASPLPQVSRGFRDYSAIFEKLR